MAAEAATRRRVATRRTVRDAAAAGAAVADPGLLKNIEIKVR